MSRLLPDGWAEAALHELAPISYGRACPKELRSEHAAYPVVGSAGVMARTRAPLVHGDCIVIGRKGNVGESHLVGGGCWPTDTTFFMVLPPSLDPRFLKLQFETLNLPGLDSSSTTPSLRRPDLEAVRVRVAPSAEQRRIVTALDEHLSRLDGVVQSMESVQKSLHALHRRTLIAAVRGDLVGSPQLGRGEENGRQLVARRCRERGLAAAVSDGPWALPEDWAWARIGDLFDVSVGSTPSRQDPDLWGGGIPWVSSGEVAFARISRTHETIAERALGNRTKQLHPPGTVMLAMIGEGKTRGQAAILDVEAAHNQNCASIRVSDSGVLPEWVYYCLVERYDRTRRQGAGNNQRALNKARVREIELPIPPVRVQRQLVSSIEKTADTIATTSTAIKGILFRCKTLRLSLLHSAFSGRLVNHDAGDEPAELLLKCIADDHTSGPTERRRRARTVPTARQQVAGELVEESA